MVTINNIYPDLTQEVSKLKSWEQEVSIKTWLQKIQKENREPQPVIKSVNIAEKYNNLNHATHFL